MVILRFAAAAPCDTCIILVKEPPVLRVVSVDVDLQVGWPGLELALWLETTAVEKFGRLTAVVAVRPEMVSWRMSASVEMCWQGCDDRGFT